MKKPIFVLTLLLALLFTQASTAQILTPHGGAAKVLFVDYGVPNKIDTLGIANGLELSYFRALSDWAYLSIPAKIAVAELAGSLNKVTTFGLDATIQFPLFPKAKTLIPYIVLGGGFTLEDFDESHIQFPLGLGANIAVGKSSFINIQAEYRKATLENRDNLQLGLGYHFRIVKKDPNAMSDRDGDTVPDETDKCPDEPGHVTANGCPDRDGDGVTDINDSCPAEPGDASASGCPDSDGDGIADRFDDCPEIPGLAAFKGCPDKDRDGDGIVDDRDDCPDEPGPKETNGCPDADGDGVADKYDLCNGEKGSKYTSGCPDSDEDGIADKFDDCPDLAGPPERRGCPMQDEDGDGVIDSMDDCPTVKGPESSNGCPDTDGDGLHDGIDKCPTAAGDPLKGGCPEISREIQDILALATSNVQFETASADLLGSSYPILQQIVEVLERYPGYNLKINGHTDNRGALESNQKLSEYRAKACYDYFISKGISKDRLSYKGFGEVSPIATNNTAEGRAQNRRVEFTLELE